MPLLLFVSFLKRGCRCIFLPKNLHMSDKSSTFAADFGKVLNYGLVPVKQNEQRRGATREE